MPSMPSLARALRSRATGAVAALVFALVTVFGAAPMQSTAAVAAGPAPGAPSAPATPAPQPAEPTTPATPVPAPADGVSLDLVSMGPGALAPGGTLSATVSVTNGTDEPLDQPRLELRAPVPRITDRAVLADWQADAEAAIVGSVAAATPAEAPALAPGETRSFTVDVAADSLGYSKDPSLWGARRVALSLSTPTGPAATLRTFTVWRPAGVTEQITQSVLLPVAADDPGAAVTDPEAFATSVSSGQLHDTLALAGRSDVDWLLDPALLDPPSIEQTADATGVEGGDGDATGDDASTDPSASPSADGQPSPGTPSSGAAEGTGRYIPSPAATQVAEALTADAGDRTVLTTSYARADLVSIDAAGAPAVRRAAEERGREALSTAGITSAGTVEPLAAGAADERSVTALQATGADALLIPSVSVREDPRSSVTPSSAAAVTTGSGTTPVLAPDPVLSDELGSLTTGSDGEQTTQRMLAESAVLAQEPSTATRQVLISPDASADLDPTLTGHTLDALAAAPWIRQGRTGALLDAATDRAWASGADDDSGALFALGTVPARDVRPAARTADGTWETQDSATPPQLLNAGVLTSLDAPMQRLEAARAAMEDPAPADVPELTALSATSVVFRGGDGAATAAARAQTGIELADAVAAEIRVQPASGYNLIASSSGVPITVTNRLGTPVKVAITVTSDKPVVRLSDEPQVVDVPARDQVEVKVPVEAVANGSVRLTVSMATVDGDQLGSPQEVTLTVNPSWENWTTVVLVVAMGLLVVVGVLRARRTGSDRRAPGVRGPEDADTLAQTGLSAPRTVNAGRHASPSAGSSAAGGSSGTGGPAPPEDGTPASSGDPSSPRTDVQDG